MCVCCCPRTGLVFKSWLHFGQRCFLLNNTGSIYASVVKYASVCTSLQFNFYFFF